MEPDKFPGGETPTFDQLVTMILKGSIDRGTLYEGDVDGRFCPANLNVADLVSALAHFGAEVGLSPEMDNLEPLPTINEEAEWAVERFDILRELGRTKRMFSLEWQRVLSIRKGYGDVMSVEQLLYSLLYATVHFELTGPDDAWCRARDMYFGTQQRIELIRCRNDMLNDPICCWGVALYKYAYPDLRIFPIHKREWGIPALCWKTLHVGFPSS